MKERKQFTKEFKEGAARLVTEQGRTIADAAKSLGVSPWTRVAVGQSGKEWRDRGVSRSRSTHPARTGEL